MMLMTLVEAKVHIIYAKYSLRASVDTFLIWKLSVRFLLYSDQSKTDYNFKNIMSCLFVLKEVDSSLVFSFCFKVVLHSNNFLLVIQVQLNATTMFRMLNKLETIMLPWKLTFLTD